MTQVPTGAQLSDDGQWWWDGNQWQPVPDAGAAPAQASTAEATPASGADPASASSQGAGQLSEDGQWQWDGSQWQPAQSPVAAGGGESGSAQQSDQSGADQPIQWDMGGASTGALFTLNEQPDPQEQSDEQQV
jgi:hypothetical protein